MKSKKRGREQRREEEEEEEGRGAKGMDFYRFLWIILDTCIDFYGFVWEKKNQTINPFLMNLDLYIGCVLDLGWLIVILN